MYNIAPIRNVKTSSYPWEGNCNKKPWQYKITAMIPVLDTSNMLEICINLLRLQTVRPFIIVIDTGSCDEEFDKIKKLRNEDVEVHSIQLNGVLHPSDFPAMAMDLAFSLCRTEYAFATHADCFLRKRTFLEELLILSEKSPVVGYEMSPRAHDDWRGMVSHTATLYHMQTMDRIGFGWSMRRLANIYGVSDYRPNPMRPNWPDTEILGNYILRKYKIQPHLIGHEKNFARHVDENIDHIRSYTSGKLYSPEYMATAEEWLHDAVKEAKDRIELWKKN